MPGFRIRGFGSVSNPPAEAPGLLLQSVIETLGPDPDGVLVQAVAVPWIELLEILRRDPHQIHSIDSRKMEELIAAAYDKAGFDKVILTPRSGDLGRDVIAIKNGIGSIKIIDQVKAYQPGHLVTANDVRALVGVLSMERDASKGVVTTTSDFAPGIQTDSLIKPLMPYRLELRPREQLLTWLAELSDNS